MQLLSTRIVQYFICSLFIFLASCTIPPGNSGMLRAHFVNGQAVYTTDQFDSSGTEIRWDHMPLRYFVDGDQKLIKRAAREWNTQLRFTAFVQGTETDADVYIVTGQPYYVVSSVDENVDMRIGGRTQHSMYQGKLRAHTSISDVGSIRLEYIITMHELGHVLGLNDSDFNDSVMRRVQRDDTELPWNAPANSGGLTFATWVADGDKRVLRNLYRPR